MASDDRPEYLEPAPGAERLPDLHYYASHGDWDGVCEALQSGQDVNAKDVSHCRLHP